MLRAQGARQKEGATRNARSGAKGRSSAGMTARTMPASTSAPTTTASGIRGSPGRAAGQGGGGRPGDAGRLPDPRRRDLRRPLPQGVRRADRELRHLLGGEGGSLSLPRFRCRNAPSPRSGRRRMRSGGSSPVPMSTATRSDPDLLQRILPAFDRETADFFRWQVSYAREELEAILRDKIGDRLRRPPEPRTPRTRPLRPDPPASDRGIEGHGRRREGTGDPPLALAEPSVQQRLHRLARPGSPPAFRPASPSTGRAGGTASASARSGPP